MSSISHSMYVEELTPLRLADLHGQLAHSDILQLRALGG
jgi:hypothetical protein